MNTRPDPYDIAGFRQRGHDVLDAIVDSFARVQSGDAPVMPWKDPGERAREWALDPSGQADLVPMLRRFFDASTHIHHPRFAGHQVSAPEPTAALSRFVVALLNSSAAIDEMSPAGVMIERAVVRWMCDKAGLGPDAGGVFVSGGSLGNLTVLLAMRQVKSKHDAWGEGAFGGKPPAILASDQSHYSVRRAVQVMGWGHDGVITVPTDDRFRMRPDALDDALARARSLGRETLGVVTASCCTATGSFDPIEPVADFCDAHDLWLHVDGAHGAPLVLCPEHRHHLNGMHRADSIVWDAHKLMGVPALATAVLYADGSHGPCAFQQDASYVFTDEDRARRPELAESTLECTKPALSMPTYVLLATLGEDHVRRHIGERIRLAKQFAGRVAEMSDFELLTDPECNIVCFRYLPGGGVRGEELDALQARIRTALIRSGEFYITQARIRGAIWLRITVMSAATTDGDLESLLEGVRTTARGVAIGPS